MHAVQEFAGTAVRGDIKMAESAINELLNAPRSPLRGATLALMDGDEVVLRYGVLHARARLPRAIEVGSSPRVTLVLASVLVAVAVRAVVRLPYIEVSGREVTIRLADVPALGHLREVWPHVTSAGLRTQSRTLALNFTFSVKEAA